MIVNLQRLAGIVGLALTMSALAAPMAQATMITQTVSFIASDFTNSPPVDPVKGTVTFTIDPALDYTAEAAGISMSLLNITLSSALQFNYSSVTHSLIFGGANQGPNAVEFGQNDFYLRFTIDNLAAGGDDFSYSQSTAVTGYFAHKVTLQPGPFATTPIPGSVTLLGTALLALVPLGLSRIRASDGRNRP